MNDSRTEASYEVTVSTEKGTGEKVTVSDQYQKNSNYSGIIFQYKKDSLKVYRVGTDGSTTKVSGYNLNWTTDSAGEPGFTITELPALEAGQKYVVDYKAAVTGTAADRMENWRIVSQLLAESIRKVTGTRSPGRKI